MSGPNGGISLSPDQAFRGIFREPEKKGGLFFHELFSRVAFFMMRGCRG
jgi:hypothetical protein